MYSVAAMAAGSLAFAIWDPTWNSYNNCYLTQQVQGWVVIDCGKRDHIAELAAAIRGVGVQPQDIATVIMTHGHRDHVGGLSLFVEAEAWMSSRDASLVSDATRLGLRPLDSAQSVAGLTVIPLGHHTPGSVALYDPTARVLYAGDYLCFFREELPPEGLVTEGTGLREKTRTFIAEWSEHPADRQRYHFDEFMHGLKILASWDRMDVLATGHGPVLTGGITPFLADLLEYGGQRQ